jgi:hypothetical protein
MLPRVSAAYLANADMSDIDARVEHTLPAILAQRIYGLALGYEDLNDHEQLRHDPLLALLAGKREPDEPLAGKSTLNRMELKPEASPAASHRYRKVTYSPEQLAALLVDIFLEAHSAAPAQIVLDLDVTDSRCTASRKSASSTATTATIVTCRCTSSAASICCARQRASNQDARAGAREGVERIVCQIRRPWPEVQIILRADSGFCREPLMAWCEAHVVHFVFGLARNERLEAKIADIMAQAQSEHQQTKQPARVFAEFAYQTHTSWSRARCVVAKAEYLDKGPKPAFCGDVAGGRCLAPAATV